jgi:hypothetical protein
MRISFPIVIVAAVLATIYALFLPHEYDVSNVIQDTQWCHDHGFKSRAQVNWFDNRVTTVVCVDNFGSDLMVPSLRAKQ